MSDSDNTGKLDDNVYAEQIKLLYSGSVYRPILHLISGVIFVAIIFDDVPPLYAIAWFGILMSICLYRAIDIKSTQTILDTIEDYKSLQNRFALSVGFTGATYGIGTAIFFKQLPILNQIYLVCLMSVMTPAGLVSLASDKYSFSLFFYSIVLPLLITIISLGEFPYINIGACIILYIFVVRHLFTWHYATLTNAIRLKLENKQLSESLYESNSQLTQLSVIDELTQIANRRHFDEVLEKEWLRAKRISSALSLLLIDIDYFKQYNDTFGHLKGDECLSYIADTLKINLNRPGDFVARYGGEEFCIIMPETDLVGAIAFAEKINSTIIELKIENPGSEVSKYLTVSVGVATIVPKERDSYMDLIYTSDKALYKAKKDGRNIIRSRDILEKNPKPRLVV
jgi:diguanylate cyclase (GGDEF)-like protein